MASPRKITMVALQCLVVFMVLVSQVQAEAPRKLKLLAFHGWGSNSTLYAANVNQWDSAILDRLDITYLNGWYPAGYPDEIFDEYSFEWFQVSADTTHAYNYELCVRKIVEFMEENGPFDGVMGHSQGGVLAGLIAAVQFRGKPMLGKSVRDVPRFKLVVNSAGSYLRDPEIDDLFPGTPIDIPLLQFIARFDVNGYPKCVKNLEFWKDPVAIYLNQSHGPPIFDAEDYKVIAKFLDQVQSTL